VSTTGRAFLLTMVMAFVLIICSLPLRSVMLPRPRGS
jgi:hypothetical protein